MASHSHSRTLRLPIVLKSRKKSRNQSARASHQRTLSTLTAHSSIKKAALQLQWRPMSTHNSSRSRTVRRSQPATARHRSKFRATKCCACGMSTLDRTPARTTLTKKDPSIYLTKCSKIHMVWCLSSSRCTTTKSNPKTSTQASNSSDKSSTPSKYASSRSKKRRI